MDTCHLSRRIPVLLYCTSSYYLRFAGIKDYVNISAVSLTVPFFRASTPTGGGLHLGCVYFLGFRICLESLYQGPRASLSRQSTLPNKVINTWWMGGHRDAFALSYETGVAIISSCSFLPV